MSHANKNSSSEQTLSHYLDLTKDIPQHSQNAGLSQKLFDTLFSSKQEAKLYIYCYKFFQPQTTDICHPKRTVHNKASISSPNH